MTATPHASRTLVSTIAGTLQEPNVDLVRRVVRVLGETRAQALLEETLTIEAAGGLLIADQSRRRTPGGVFFHVVKATTPRKLRMRMFPPPEGSPRAASPPSCTWSDVQEAMQTLVGTTPGEAHTVKLTLIGRPTTTQTRGQAVIFQLTGKPPATLARGLPPLPPRPPIVWTVLVALRQWNRVKDSLAAHPDDTLVIEGYPVVDQDRHLLLAQSCLSVAMQRARKAAQNTEAPQEGRGGAG
jgi:PHAX RNA-binding domain